MVVSESCADGLANIEPAAWSVEFKHRRGKGVVLAEKQSRMIEATLIVSIESINAEMEIQQSLSRYKSMLNGLIA